MFAKLKVLNALETLGVAFLWYLATHALLIVPATMEPPNLFLAGAIVILISVGTLALIGSAIAKALRRADRAQMRGDWK